jgi:hypothetical protein
MESSRRIAVTVSRYQSQLLRLTGRVGTGERLLLVETGRRCAQGLGQKSDSVLTWRASVTPFGDEGTDLVVPSEEWRRMVEQVL